MRVLVVKSNNFMRGEEFNEFKNKVLNSIKRDGVLVLNKDFDAYVAEFNNVRFEECMDVTCLDELDEKHEKFEECLTYAQIFKEFINSGLVDLSDIADYRPCIPPYCEVKDCDPGAIVVWTKNLGKIIYKPKEYVHVTG